MRGGPGWHAQLAGELVEWCEDLCERGTGSRAVLVAVPPGREVTTALDHLAAAVGFPLAGVAAAGAGTAWGDSPWAAVAVRCSWSQR
jgi:hypothetical protein